MLIVVGLVIAKDPSQMGLVPDEGPVQELAAASPDPAFGDRVHAGRRYVARDGPDASGGHDRTAFRRCQRDPRLHSLIASMALGGELPLADRTRRTDRAIGAQWRPSFLSLTTHGRVNLPRGPDQTRV